MDISSASLGVLLDDAIKRDRTTARRAALLNILQHEGLLTREQLIVRVEGKITKGCFGDSAWEDTFYRDMQVVKRAFNAANYQLAYSRSLKQPGYYLRDQPPISAELSATLEGSVVEVDPSQMAIFKRLSFAQRFQQGCSISDLARQVVGNRIRQGNLQSGFTEAERLSIRDKGQR